MIKFALSVVFTVLFIGVGIITILTMHGTFDPERAETCDRILPTRPQLAETTVLAQPSGQPGDFYGKALFSNKDYLVVVAEKAVYFLREFAYAMNPVRADFHSAAFCGQHLFLAIDDRIDVYELQFPDPVLVKTLDCEAESLWTSESRLFACGLERTSVFLNLELEYRMDPCDRVLAEKETAVFISASGARVYKNRELEREIHANVADLRDGRLAYNEDDWTDVALTENGCAFLGNGVLRYGDQAWRCEGCCVRFVDGWLVVGDPQYRSGLGRLNAFRVSGAGTKSA